MALSGNLRDFSLPDVFQLVSFSHKTGTLAIDRGDAKGFVYFKDGEVFFAISNWNREPMGKRLVRGEKITDRQLHKVLEIQKSDATRRRLGQILVDEGFLTPKVLQTFVQEQIQDTIFDLFRWEEGEFDFKADVIPTEEDIGLSVSVENIIMEGSRRLEEWERIRKKIPTLDASFMMATQPGEGTFEIALKPSEWKLLCLLDGRRTVRSLSELLELSDFEVSRILYGMFSGGLLERTDEQAPAADVAPVMEAETETTPAPRLEVVPEPTTVTPEEIAPEVEAAAAGPALEKTLEGAEQAPAEVTETAETQAVSEPTTAGPTPEAAETRLDEEGGAGEVTIEPAATGLGEIEEEEAEVSELDLADELTALTGGSETKPRGGPASRATQTAKADEVPLHVDSRLSKELLMRIIEGIKRL